MGERAGGLAGFAGGKQRLRSENGNALFGPGSSVHRHWAVASQVPL
jgi:hypothetical protein